MYGNSGKKFVKLKYESYLHLNDYDQKIYAKSELNCVHVCVHYVNKQYRTINFAQNLYMTEINMTLT